MRAIGSIRVIRLTTVIALGVLIGLPLGYAPALAQSPREPGEQHAPDQEAKIPPAKKKAKKAPCDDQCEMLRDPCDDTCKKPGKTASRKAQCKDRCEQLARVCHDSCREKGEIDAEYMKQHLTKNLPKEVRDQ
jgi:hypothetical protein